MVNKELLKFAEISQIIASTLDTSEVYDNLVKLVVEAVNVDRGILYIDRNDTLISVAGYGAPREHLLNNKLDKNTSVFGRLYRDGKPQLMQASRQTDVIKRLDAGKYYVVPVGTRHKMIGLLAVDNKISNRSLEDLDEDLLVALAGQLAVAIENARRYEDSQEKVRELARLDRQAQVGLMVSDITHQIKNPLAAMKMAAQLAEMYPDKQQFWAEYGSIITDEIKRLENVVETFLGFTRKKEIKIQPVDLEEIIRKVLDMIKVQAHQQNVELVLQSAEPLHILADAQSFQEVILNLLNNAIEAMPKNHKGRIEITAAADTVKSAAILTISDNGCGISKENQKKLFTPFFTTKVKGNGFGLPYVHRIIEEEYKGRIEVTSELNVGTTFTIQIPLAEEKSVD
ncbi:hypothetical protein RDn1_224 [Candidatus Termititenax dinenymphae]|uniref:histidine kinase n=1 Tax=Candidatus Termititenax dinenymphae TaxID=2218523 RepID=A0A388TMU0_9BACT|nr:hypothetical protein RDn1_224 [Candidatus Termititenax dinenymphae]